jgi:glutathione S-transferase
MMRLWGRKSSINVQKVLWCLTELGLKEGKDFERIDAGLHYGINNTPEFLKLNPNGLVPTLEDGEVVLWESNTIMRYLAYEHDKAGRFSSDSKTKYESEKWIDWQLGTMWPALRIAFLGLTRTSEAERNHQAIPKGYQATNRLLGMLDQTLAKQNYCSGNQFQPGDIVLALCVSRWILLNKTFPQQTGGRTDLKNIDVWLKRLEEETCINDIAEKELNIVK